MQIHHENIQRRLAEQLEKATSGIRVAVAWFTNKELFGLLLNKLAEGVAVELIILNDLINFWPKGINFQQLISGGGRLYIASRGRKLHHKFCIIDQQTICTGSYNWTYHAEHENFENMVIATRQPQLTDALNEAFEVVKAGADQIEDLARFHQLYPPCAAQCDAEYQADESALEWLSNETQDGAGDSFPVELTSDNIQRRLQQVSLDRLEPSLRNSVMHRKEALRELLMRFHDWSAEELRLHHDRLDKAILCKNERIRWTAEKLTYAGFPGEQFAAVCRIARLDNLAGILTQFEEEIDWYGLVQNSNLPWTAELLTRFSDRIVWSMLYMDHPSLFWDEALIGTFAEQMNWHRLSGSGNVDWSDALIHRFESQIDFRNLSANPHLAWSPALFERYRSRLNFYVLSANEGFCWSEEIVIADEHRWDWERLSQNRGMCWNESLIRRYHQKFHKSVLLENEGITWTAGMLRGLSDWLSSPNINYMDGWGALACVNGSWKTPLILQTFADRFHLGYVCSNTRLDWRAVLRTSLAERVMQYWKLPNTTRVGLIGLAENPTFPWSETLLKDYQDRIGKNDAFFYALVNNRSFYKTEKFVDIYRDQINFNLLSRQPEAGWSLALLEKYRDRWDWQNLSTNPAIPWTAALLENPALDWERIAANESVYQKVLKPFLNGNLLYSIMTA